MGEPSNVDSQLRRHLDEVSSRLAVSRAVASSSPTLKNQLIFLDDLLTAKEGDGIEDTATGLPNLNSDIRATMQRIAADLRFPDLMTSCKDDSAPEFPKVWGYLEKQAQTWKDDDDRMTRLQHGENIVQIIILVIIDLLHQLPRKGRYGSALTPEKALPSQRKNDSREEAKIDPFAAMARGQKEAFEAHKAFERLRDMVASRQFLVKIKTTSFNLKKLDTQIRLASDIGVTGIRDVHEQRNLTYDELTKWLRILSEVRLKMYEMEAPSLVEPLGDVEQGIRLLLGFF
ncbi:MAG: hypothetical protein Q9195_006424 [Heterodermia aff. obscurata]